MCVCIYICVCMCVYISIYVYVCVYVFNHESIVMNGRGMEKNVICGGYKSNVETPRMR